MPPADHAPPADRARVAAVLGSARRDGHAARLLDAVLDGRPAQRFDLAALRVGDYAYGQSADDDFVAVARAVVEADAVVLATPVYWYAMSAPLKRFVDRLTDLVTVRKPLGRRLAGRTLWLVACGSDPALPEGFEVPFERTAAYFDMDYGGALYLAVHDETAPGAGLAGAVPGGVAAEAAQQAAAFGSRVYASRRPRPAG